MKISSKSDDLIDSLVKATERDSYFFEVRKELEDHIAELEGKVRVAEADARALADDLRTNMDFLGSAGCGEESLIKYWRRQLQEHPGEWVGGR